MNPQNYTINIRPGWGISQVVKVSQGDVGRPLAFTIMDGQDALTIASGTTVTITGTKPSGLGFTQACTLSGNTASIDTVATMTQEAGSIPAELIVTDGSTVIGTANFVMYVEPAAHPEGTTDGDAETARDLMTRAEAAVAQAEAEADRAEEAAESVSQTGISTVGATAGQVPTANGAGGWNWQDQQGGGGTSDDIENKSTVSGSTVTDAFNAVSGQLVQEQTARGSADESLRSAIDALVSPSGQSVVVDNSLSISGAAADAKAVGDKIDDLKSNFNSFKGDVDYTVNHGQYIDSNGQIQSNILQDLYTVKVYQGMHIKGICGNTSNGIAYIAFYDADENLLGDPIRNNASGTYNFNYNLTVPQNANTLKVSHRNNVNVTFSIEINNVTPALQSLSSVNGLTNYQTIDFATGTSGYINTNGVLAPHESYWHTQPFSVKTGDVITVNTRGSANVVCIIARQNTDGSYTPLVNATTSELRSYKYTAPYAFTAVVSYRYDTNDYSGNIKFHVSTNSIQEIADNLNDRISSETNGANYAQIFHKVGVIGDSLASGEIAYVVDGTNTYIDKYEYSWLSNFCRACGTEAVHFSKGGLTAKSWLSDTGGKRTELENDSGCNAYFIALGTNDVASGIALGAVSDTAGSDTFVGYMKQIIELVHAKAPNSTVFLMSTYADTSISHTWSDVISEIAGLYDYCYYVDFVNNTTIYSNYSTPYSSLGHFTTPAYVEVGDAILKLVNKIVFDNYSSFMFFAVNN